MEIRDHTFSLLYDYCIFRAHISSVQKNKLKEYPLPKVTEMTKKMRYLGHKFSNDVTVWPHLTEHRDFSIADYENFRNCVHEAFEECQTITSKIIYAYFEFVAVCCVYSVSTAVYGSNLEEICLYATQYLSSSSKFIDFIIKEHGWEGFINSQYGKHKNSQQGIFKHWLQVLNNQE